MDSYEFSGFLRMEIHRFPSDLLTSRVTKMEPPGLVFDTTRMEELKVARSFWRRSCVVIYSDVPSFMRKHPPKKKQLKIPLSVFSFTPFFWWKQKGAIFSALLCWSYVCFFLRFPLRIVGCRENRRILGWIHGGFGKTAGNIPQMMVSLVREVFPLKISRKNPTGTPKKVWPDPHSHTTPLTFPIKSPSCEWYGNMGSLP